MVNFNFFSHRPSNYTLGVGENRINMLVVDITHSEPWVINSYTVNVYRQSLGEDEEEDFAPGQLHQVCSLVQVSYPVLHTGQIYTLYQNRTNL